MTDFDQRLRAALSEDDEAFLKSLDDEPSFIEQLKSPFHGRLAPVSIFAVVLIVVFTGLMILTAWQAFQATNVRETVLWSTGFLGSLIPNGLLRLWYLHRVSHLATLRALKKIELRLVQLSAGS